ncbi:MAG TPA: helix-hairpin-helix domain-containing protein [Pyrinomonadaceae bacterium]
MPQRQLKDLVSVGPSILQDLKMLGINNVRQLTRKRPAQMYQQLCRMKGPQDICCLDVFVAAVAQANDPNLPVEQCQWWYWSRKRKEANDANPE